MADNTTAAMCTNTQVVAHESIILNNIINLGQHVVKGYHHITQTHLLPAFPDRLFFAFMCITWMQFATWFLIKGPRRTYNIVGSDLLLSEIGPIMVFIGAALGFIIYAILLVAGTTPVNMTDAFAVMGMITSTFASMDIASDCWVRLADGKLRRVVFMIPRRVEYAWKVKSDESFEKHVGNWEAYWLEAEKAGEEEEDEA